MTPPQRIGIVANIDKPASPSVAKSAIKAIRGRAHVLVQQAFAELIEMPELTALDEDIYRADVVLVFGGDGTVLGTSRSVAPHCTPMLGINLGRFGFLNEVAPETIERAIDALIAGDFAIEERLMLEADLLREGKTIAQDIALNEIVIGHANLARVLHLSMSINGKYVTTYAADGIIIATPTGSTAYSLSAGGPLVHPELKTILITPICPHTLTTRALIIPQEHEVTIESDYTDNEPVRVTMDGQRALPMLRTDTLRVRHSNFCASLVTHVGGSSFYDKLQNKLRWGERVVY